MGGPVNPLTIILFMASTIYQVDQRAKAKQAARRQAEDAKRQAAIRNIRVTNSNLPVPEIYGETRVDSIPVHFHLDRNFLGTQPNATEQAFGELSGTNLFGDFNIGNQGGSGSGNEFYVFDPENPNQNFNKLPSSYGKKNAILAIQTVLGCSEVSFIVTADIDQEPYTDEKFLRFCRLFVNKKGGGLLNNASAIYRGWDAVFDELTYATEFYKMDIDDPQYGGQPASAYYLQGALIRSYSANEWSTIPGAGGTVPDDGQLRSPEPFSAVTIQGGSFTGGYRTILSWFLVTGAIDYELQMSFLDNTEWEVVAANLQTSTFSLDTMHPLRAYRVRGRSEVGISPWAEIKRSNLVIPSRTSFATYSESGTVTPITEIVVQHQPSEMYLRGSQVYVSWPAVVGASGYRVSMKYTDPDQSDGTFLVVEDTTETSVSYPVEHEGVVFRINTIDGVLMSSGIESDVVAIVPMPRPSNVVVSTTGNDIFSLNVTLSWDAVPAATNYIVEASRDGTIFETIDTAVTGTSKTMVLRYGRVWLRVAAKSAGRRGDWTTWSGELAIAEDIPNGVLSAPENFSAAFFPTGVFFGATWHEVILTWDPVAGAEYYEIEKSVDGYTWVKMILTLNDTLFRRAVLADTYLYFRVAAGVGGLLGDRSYWDGPVDPGSNPQLEEPVDMVAPTSLELIPVRDVGQITKVNIFGKWLAGTGQDDYQVEYRTNAGNEWVVASRHPVVEAYLTEPIEEGLTLEMRVAGRAVRTSGNVLTSYISADVVAKIPR